MFVNLHKPDLLPITLPPTLFAPFGACATAALCWYLVVGKLHRDSKWTGVLLGLVSGWSIFASGLLIAFIIGIVSQRESIQDIQVILQFANAIFVIGPLFLLMAWGWIPVLSCVLWGVFCISLHARS